MIGAESLEVTFLFSARFLTPSGTNNGGRGFSEYRSSVGGRLDVLRRPDEHRLGQHDRQRHLLFVRNFRRARRPAARAPPSNRSKAVSMASFNHRQFAAFMELVDS